MEASCKVVKSKKTYTYIS